MKHKTKIQWQCHCWNIKYDFLTNLEIHEIVWRKCQCGLCLKHWANWTSDPNWKLEISIKNEENIKKYNFWYSTADFYFCKGCWVLAFAVSNIKWKDYSVLNLNSTANPRVDPKEFVNTNFDWESSEWRLERRKKNWIWEVLFK